MKFTTEQQAFINRVASTSDSLILRSVAGSGKTTTMVAASQQCKGRVLAVAFNKAIALTLQERMGSAITCKTMNALGHGAWQKAVGKRLQIDAGKTGKIVKRLLEDYAQDPSAKELWGLIPQISKLADLAKQQGIVPLTNSQANQAKPLTDDIIENWEWLARHYDIPFSQDLYDIARSALSISIDMAFQGLCDFNDQLYMPTAWNGQFSRYDTVIVDEAQDLSMIQHEMLARSMSLRARLIAVGDPNQAIYGFRGAASNSMEILAERFEMDWMNLTYTFRCPQLITAQAQEYVPDIRCPDGAPKGRVKNFSAWAYNELPNNTAIICRNVAPLIRVAMTSLKLGNPITVLGRDIGASLKFTVGQISGKRGRQFPDLTLEAYIRKSEEWFSNERMKAAAKGDEGKIAQLADREEALDAIIESGGTTIQSNADILTAIDQIFSEAKTRVIACTIHKAKGLEWPTVVFLDSFRIPAKQAKTPEALQQEYNLAYVAITRALDRLIYATSKRFEMPPEAENQQEGD